MKKNEEKLSKEAIILNEYLSQYKYCVNRKKALERRRRDIIREFDYPLKGTTYDGTPRGSGTSVGCASLSFRLDEIVTRIEEQTDKATKVLVDIMNVIEFLSENSRERIIIEHRYIDRFSWDRICREEHISRTPATIHWRKGLNKLLEFKKVQQIVQRYEKVLEEKQYE